MRRDPDVDLTQFLGGRFVQLFPLTEYIVPGLAQQGRIHEHGQYGDIINLKQNKIVTRCSPDYDDIW